MRYLLRSEALPFLFERLCVFITRHHLQACCKALRAIDVIHLPPCCIAKDLQVSEVRTPTAILHEIWRLAGEALARA